jgi:hypothetical protein
MIGCLYQSDTIGAAHFQQRAAGRLACFETDWRRSRWNEVDNRADPDVITPYF